MDIQPPIVAREGGDLWFYESVEEAERDLEASDVRDGVYEVFDSRGYPLDLVIEERERRSALLGRTSAELVRVQRRLGVEAVEAYVREKIVNFCATLPEPIEVPSGKTLPELVVWARSRFRA
jgi:hypothetical protein